MLRMDLDQSAEAMMSYCATHETDDLKKTDWNIDSFFDLVTCQSKFSAWKQQSQTNFQFKFVI